MTSKHVINFADQDYTVTITNSEVSGLKHITFHKVLVGTCIDSKFDMFLSGEQFKELCKFLCFSNNEENGNGQ